MLDFVLSRLHHEVRLKGKACLKLKAAALQGGHRVGLRWGSKGFDGWLGLRVGSKDTYPFRKGLRGLDFDYRASVKQQKNRTLDQAWSNLSGPWQENLSECDP